jgi:hypothetical protein
MLIWIKKVREKHHMANGILRVIGGYSPITESEHYIIDFDSSEGKYRHQIFVDNVNNTALHLVEGVEEIQRCSPQSARFDVLRFALISIDVPWQDKIPSTAKSKYSSTDFDLFCKAENLNGVIFFGAPGDNNSVVFSMTPKP